jgi:hypothetical protein
VDRPGRKALLRVAVVAAALAVIGAAAAQVPSYPLRAGKWLTDKDRLARLSRGPAECFRPPADPDLAWKAEIGRAVFRSPVLLGGQAAKAGLACNTCHENGRRNAGFVFPGLSGEPGTADVTSSLLSTRRGDGVFNPRRIPDLSGPSEGLPSRRLDQAQLEHFLHGIVTEEFEGDEPPAAVLAGLATYIRQLDPAACPAKTDRVISVSQDAEDVARAVRAAQGALERHDTQTALATLQAGRAMLFLIDERFSAPGLENERNSVRTASLDLSAAEGAIRRKDKAGPMLDLWLARYPAWKAQLKAKQARSLYDPGVLAVALSGAASRPTLARPAKAAAVSR